MTPFIKFVRYETIKIALWWRNAAVTFQRTVWRAGDKYKGVATDHNLNIDIRISEYSLCKIGFRYFACTYMNFWVRVLSYAISVPTGVLGSSSFSEWCFA